MSTPRTRNSLWIVISLSVWFPEGSVQGQSLDPESSMDGLRNTGSTPSGDRAPVALSTASGQGAVAGFSQYGGVDKDHRPWSSVWWPRNRSGLTFNVYSDGISPFEKYDTIYYNVMGKVAGVSSWETDPANNHNYAPYPNMPSWTGHCNGMVAASVLEAEPRQQLRFRFNNGTKLVLKTPTAASARPGFSKDGQPDYYGYSLGSNGLVLTIADQKGWLSELYQTSRNLSFATPAYHGSRNNDDRPDTASFKDIIPHYFHYLLLNYVGKGQPIIPDVDPGSPVFNKALFYFTSKSVYYPSYRIHSVRTTCYMADYATDANYVGTIIQSKDYTYQMNLDASNRVVSSSWTGSSVNDHPDFCWIPVSVGGVEGNRVNPNIEYSRVKSWIQRSQQGTASSGSSGASAPSSTNRTVYQFN